MAIELTAIVDGVGNEPALQPKMPSSVIVVNDAGHVTGGAGQVAVASAIGLARAGVTVEVFAAQGPIAGALAAEQIQVTCLDQDDILSDPNRLRAATRGIWNFAARNAFERLLDRHDARSTVVHVHGWTKALSSSVMHVAADRGFPLVISLHDYFVACPNGSLYRHRSEEICTIRPMSPRCIVEDCDHRNYAQKLWRVARQTVQAAAGVRGDTLRHVITISDLSERQLAPHLGKHTNIHRVPNPIDVDKAARVRVAANDIYLYIGRLSPEKGPQLFARAAKRAGIRAVFVGDGECAEELRRINPDAEITGWLPHEAVKDYIDRARVIVVPSLWYEIGPLVVLEAAARGVPAIVADSCGACEDLADEDTGLIFRSGNQVDLVTKLTQFADDLFAQRLGEAAYSRYWRAPRSLEVHVAGLRDVYAAMLSQLVLQ